MIDWAAFSWRELTIDCLCFSFLCLFENDVLSEWWNRCLRGPRNQNLHCPTVVGTLIKRVFENSFRGFYTLVIVSLKLSQKKKRYKCSKFHLLLSPCGSNEKEIRNSKTSNIIIKDVGNRINFLNQLSLVL